jgi:uncharacterized protein affecting Mg2+/Co2+ transport
MIAIEEIIINIETAYISNQSEPEKNQFVYS